MWTQKTRWTTAKKQTFDGVKYDSGFEADFARELLLRQKAKDIQKFEAHVKIPLTVNGFLICNYYIDFKVYNNDGIIEMVECKGWQSEIWKIKWKIFCALYEKDPNTKITLICQGKYSWPKLRKIKL